LIPQPANVIVIDPLKGTCDHGIPKMEGAFHRDNFTREALADAKMNCLPGYFLSFFDQS